MQGLYSLSENEEALLATSSHQSDGDVFLAFVLLLCKEGAVYDREIQLTLTQGVTTSLALLIHFCEVCRCGRVTQS